MAFDDYVIVGIDQGAVQLGAFNGWWEASCSQAPRSKHRFLASAPPTARQALLPVLSTQLWPRPTEPCFES